MCENPISADKCIYWLVKVSVHLIKERIIPNVLVYIESNRGNSKFQTSMELFMRRHVRVTRYKRRDN